TAVAAAACGEQQAGKQQRGEARGTCGHGNLLGAVSSVVAHARWRGREDQATGVFDGWRAGFAGFGAGRGKEEGRREKGEGRREKGEGRREKGEARRACPRRMGRDLPPEVAGPKAWTGFLRINRTGKRPNAFALN